MSKLTLSRCACLVAVFAVLGGLLAAGPNWGVASPVATASLEQVALNGLIALAAAVIGAGWVLVRFRTVAHNGVEAADTHGLRLDESGAAVVLLGQREEAEAIAEAVQIFRNGLGALNARPVEPPSVDAAWSIAELAAQTSVMALRATLAAAQGDGRFATAAARVKALAEQAAVVSDVIASEAQRIEGTPDQDPAVIAESVRALRAAASLSAVEVGQQASDPAAPSRTHSRWFSRTERAA